MEVLSLLLGDLTTLARFEGTAVPHRQPSTNPDPIVSLLLRAKPHFSFLQLRDALLSMFTERGTVYVDPDKLLGGDFGLNSIVMAFYRLLKIEEGAEVVELRWWLESLVFGALVQSWRYQAGNGADLRAAVRSLSVAKSLLDARRVFPNSIVPVELQVLINPHLSNLVGANLPPPAIRASSAPKRASDDEDGERTAKRAFTRRNAAVDLKYEEENENLSPPILSTSTYEPHQTRSHLPRRLSPLSNVLTLPHEHPSLPSTPRIDSPRPPSANGTTYFWCEEEARLLHSSSSTHSITDREVLEFPRSSFAGPLLPDDPATNDFIRAQSCITNCPYVIRSATKPIRIREHFSRCPIRKAHFAELGTEDPLGRLSELQIVAQRQSCAAGETRWGSPDRKSRSQS